MTNAPKMAQNTITESAKAKLLSLDITPSQRTAVEDAPMDHHYEYVVTMPQAEFDSLTALLRAEYRRSIESP